MRFKVLKKSEVVLRLNEPNQVMISPSRKVLVQYQYEDTESEEPGHFLLTVRNIQQFPVCSLVSIQPLENEVRFARVSPGNLMTCSCMTNHRT